MQCYGIVLLPSVFTELFSQDTTFDIDSHSREGPTSYEHRAEIRLVVSLGPQNNTGPTKPHQQQLLAVVTSQPVNNGLVIQLAFRPAEQCKFIAGDSCQQAVRKHVNSIWHDGRCDSVSSDTWHCADGILLSLLWDMCASNFHKSLIRYFSIAYYIQKEYW